VAEQSTLHPKIVGSNPLEEENSKKKFLSGCIPVMLLLRSKTELPNF
jgi:hypothetical protein